MTTNTNHPSTSRKLLTIRGDKVKLRRVRWLTKPFLALEELTVLAGLPGVGKGTLSNRLITDITKGLLGDRDEVLVFTAEETHATSTLPRIKVAGGDLSKVHIVRGVGSAELTDDSDSKAKMLALATDTALIDDYLKESPRVALVVIDPIDCYFGNAKKNDAGHVTAIYECLKGIAERRNLSVLLVDHLNKDGSKAAIHRISGAGAAGARPRLVWLVGQDHDPANSSIRHITSMKGNILSEKEKRGQKFEIVGVPIEIDGEMDSYPVAQWRGDSNETSDSLLAVSHKTPLGAPNDAILKAMDFLREQLADGEQLSSDVSAAAQRTGIDTSNGGTLFRAKKELGLKSYQKEKPGPWYLPGILTPSFGDPLDQNSKSTQQGESA